MSKTTVTVNLNLQGTAATTPQTAKDQQANARELQNAARELRDAIRHNVDQQLIQTQAEDAANAALARAGQIQVNPPTPPSRPGPFTVRGPNGTITFAPGAFDHVIPPQVVDISIAFFVTMAIIIIGLPIARAFARRMDRKTAGGQVGPEVSAQIANLNHAVDAIAVEVERISEGQRFTTRLLTEQRDAGRTTLPSAVNR